jgi:NAD+ diphosphatase
MVAFTAEWAEGELRIEPLEIEDAGWFTACNLPRLPPRISIARAMIDDFVKQQGLDPDGPMTTG